MAWDFETDPQFQEKLDWVQRFVDAEVAPVDRVVEHAWDVTDPTRNKLIRPLQDLSLIHI